LDQSNQQLEECKLNQLKSVADFQKYFGYQNFIYNI